MRTDITATELLIQAERARRVAPVRLEIQNGSGTWKELTNLSGTGFANLNFLKSLSWSDDVDTPTWSGNVTLAHALRAPGGAMISIAPDIETSPANVDDLDDYDPLIDGMRRIRWFTTTHRLDGTGGVERKVFDGYVVSTEQGDTLNLQVADLGHLLVITQIRDERVYGSTEGEPLEEVIQQILDDNMGVGAITLVVDPAITAAGVMVRVSNPGRVKVMEAIRTLAIETIGANVRYMWNAAGEMELRLFLPPRTKIIPDFTFNADNYKPKPTFRRLTEDIRNTGRLYYQSEDTQSVLFVEYHVLESIERYFARYFEFREISTKNVNTQAEASRMLTNAITDLAFPKAEKKFTTDYAWPFEVHDLLLMEANGEQYTTDQPQFVTRITHTYAEAGQTQTQFDTRGTIAGFSNQWLIREGPGPRPNDDDALAVTFGMGGEGSMFGGEMFNTGGLPAEDGCVWPALYIGKSIKRVHIWHRETAGDAADLLWPPTGSDMYKAVTLERPEGDIPRLGNFTFPDNPIFGPRAGQTVWRMLIPLPTTPDSTAGVIVQAETFDGVLGAQERLSAVATDSPGNDPGALSTMSVTRINATTVRITGTVPSGLLGTTLVFRDGINIDQIDAAGGTSFSWDDTGLHAEKSYKYTVCRLQNNVSGGRTTVLIDAWATSFVFADNTPEGVTVAPGVPRIKIAWSGTPVGTTHVRVLKSRDSGHYDPWAVATTLPVADQPFYDVVVYAGQYYQLQALDATGAVLDTSEPAYWAYINRFG
jgi:hypothetical protein